jgi:hypothetical protein
LVLLFSGPFREGDGEKKNAAQAKFAIFVAIPLGKSVCATAIASCTD